MAQYSPLQGFLQGQRHVEQQGQREMQQAQGLMGILSKVRAQEQEQKVRGILSSLPPDATPEQVLSALRPHLPAATLATMLQNYQTQSENRAARSDDRKFAVESRTIASQDARDGRVAAAATATSDRVAAAALAAKNRTEDQRRQQEFLLANRPPRQPNKVTDADGNVKFYDNSGNLIKDLGRVGAPGAAYQKASAARRKLNSDIDVVISELELATKDGGVIDQSTGSGAGAAADVVADFVGYSTKGSIAVGKMKPVFDLVLKMVPRFEGPQSDKDVKTYADAAGDIANPNVPNARKKEAGKEILRLMRKRRGQFINKDIEGTEADIAAPRSSATSLSGEDAQALNWANSNPNDPRAAQIKQRLGQ